AGDQSVQLVPTDAGVLERCLDGEDGAEFGRLARQLTLIGVTDADDGDSSSNVVVHAYLSKSLDSNVSIAYGRIARLIAAGCPERDQDIRPTSPVLPAYCFSQAW